jgi:hypothetical protein
MGDDNQCRVAQTLRNAYKFTLKNHADKIQTFYFTRSRESAKGLSLWLRAFAPSREIMFG